MNEFFVQKMLKEIMNKNKNVTSLIGKGFHGTRTPIPIKRYVLENPKWYTPYTPYQAEISQGRLESLFNYQQMISSITGLPCSNASLLDGGSTAAEVLSMCHHKNKGDTFYASDTMHPYILDILKTKSAALNIDLHICEPSKFSLNDDTSGFMLQYPNTYGDVNIPTDLISEANEKKITASCSTDLLALTKYKSPAEFGFDIAFGTSQRFGVPLYFGGPHAAFLATTPEFLRAMPGRIVGISKDQQGDSCFRLALQSREQHIRKEKATSNICTSQALLANISTFYAIYHGNDGLHEIANSIFDKASKLKQFLHIMNYEVKNENYFDTITLDSLYTYQIYSELKEKNIIPFWNSDEPSLLSFTFDETTTEEDMDEIFNVLAKYGDVQTSSYNVDYLSTDQKLMRNSDYLPEKIFNSVNRNETKFMRYVNKLADKDYSLTTGMIPLGSCTMKENSAYQLEPMSWDTVANSH
jgi:glycine dehydrogenase